MAAVSLLVALGTDLVGESVFSPETQSLVDALSIIEHIQFRDDLHPYEGQWLQRINQSLAVKLDRQFRDRVLPTSEQAAFALMKDVAGELLSAAHALDMAAETLKNQAWCGHKAGLVHQAAQRARAAAEGLVGT